MIQATAEVLRQVFAFVQPTAEPICEMPLPSLIARQVSTENVTNGQDAQHKSRTETFSSPSKSVSTSQVQLKRVCSLSIHDDSRHDDSRNDVSVNLDHLQGSNIKVGDLMQIKPFNGAANISMNSSGSQLLGQGRSGPSYSDIEFHSPSANSRGSGQKQKHDHSELTSNLSKRFIVAIKDMSSEQKTKQPGCQVCCFLLVLRCNLFQSLMILLDFCFRAHCHKTWPEKPRPSIVVVGKSKAPNDVKYSRGLSVSEAR